ncbi:MAG TPA: PLP-dependent aspartate aminotransferase family protein [Pirellulaceae bacterium]|jgi:cystathionine beta-lyase/cystathionine gamma-synthase|nr:PLP-dependent aspartate aminotransferase family protein [Pirellulaceae bacterium]
MKFRTRAIHVGSEPDPLTGAVVPPIHFASTFVQKGAGEWGAYDYSRSGNPTRRNFETTLADLEGASFEQGGGALAFASGMAAIHCVTMLLSAGDEIVAGSDIYGGAYRLLHKICNRSGIAVKLVDTTDPAKLEAALTDRTKLVWLESPGNPLLSITDLAACAEIAHARGALVGTDSTFATPVLTRPLELGLDIVMHSSTKYLGGHSDVLGGALVVKQKELFDRLYFVQNATGAVQGPMECFLLSRGLKTLELRVREHCRIAQEIAEFLAVHPRVTKVNYPGLPRHPGHEVARRQMDGGFGAMISFEADGDLARTKRLVASTKLFALAVSLGAVESLIEQPATMSHASYDPADRKKHGISDSLVRLSVGLEDVDDLKEDLDQALRSA